MAKLFEFDLTRIVLVVDVEQIPPIDTTYRTCPIIPTSLVSRVPACHYRVAGTCNCMSLFLMSWFW